MPFFEIIGIVVLITIVFVEVKSGQSQLSKIQKSLKSAIEEKNVLWHDYKVPEELTKKK